MNITGHILVADDDNTIRTVVCQALARAGFKTRSTSNVATLWTWIEAGEGDVVVTDVTMPDGDALDLLPAIRKKRPDLPVIVMSARNTVMTAIRATDAGAYEYLPKPFDLKEMIASVRKALAGVGRRAAAEAHQPPEEALPLVGRSSAMQELYRAMARLMATDLTVLISGESGTGKELVARALHDYGRRKGGPFVAVNMAAIPRELIESELFGHERGAFTGAVGRGVGKFEQAKGGTLFLDEIGDMPPEAQTRLLRVLQEGEYTAVGGRSAVKTDIRIVCATHQDLRGLIREGLFREDLYYRINVAQLRLPPLRDRLEDVADLARAFLTRAADLGLPDKRFTAAGLAALQKHDWPGNVRELENAVKRLVALASDDVIDAPAVEAELTALRDAGDGRAEADSTLSSIIEAHLQQYFALHGGALPPPGLYQRVLREIEYPLLTLTLNATRGNQIKASELLGLNRNTLRKKMRELDIPATRGKK